MRYALTILLPFFFLISIYPQNASHVVTTDIDNFWTAYDEIVTTGDKAEQLNYLNKLFIEKGTPGLQAMMQARQYTPEEYLEAINGKPAYWASIRPNTLKAEEFAGDIESGVEKLRKIYPELKPANIYFTVGVFRSGGTTSGHNILISSEIIFADEKIMDTMVFTNIHEYVHTQQNTNEVENLLGQSVMEGVAEFVTTKALGISSFAPAIDYGKNNEARVKNAFAAQRLNPYFSYWLYNDAKNEFGPRDLGYYVGYAIAEKYYEKAKDKQFAVKEMIALDYNNPAALAKYVDQSGSFPKSVKTLTREFERNRPQIVSIAQFKNGERKVSLQTTRLTIGFSKEMNPAYRNFNFGSLGKENSIRIKSFLGFSADGKSFSVEIEPLQPSKRYQLVIGSGFRDKAGASLKPYVIDMTTADKGTE